MRPLALIIVPLQKTFHVPIQPQSRGLDLYENYLQE